MGLAISSMEMCAITSLLCISLLHTRPLEHKYRAVLLGTQEGRCEPADGVLSGPFIVMLLTPVCGLERLSSQPGVGTYSIPQIVTRVRARFQKYINMAIANHLSAHVMSKAVPLMRVYYCCNLHFLRIGGYEFLMQNCRPV